MEKLSAAQIRTKVFGEKKALAALYRAKGNLPLARYFAATQKSRSAPNLARQRELIRAVEAHTTHLLGARVAKNAARELLRNYAVSTADHHGPLCHPFFFNASLLRSQTSEDTQSPILVFAFGGVSLNNSSFPRGVFFHAENGEVRVPFWSLKYRHEMVYSVPSYTKKQLDAALNLAPLTVQVRALLDSIYRNPRVLALSRYAHQITRTNHELWRRVPGEEGRDLVYLQIEDIVNDLLAKHHLKKKTILWRILFEEKLRADFLKNFDGVTGAFSAREKKGTHLFWGNHHGKRVALRAAEGRLESGDGTFRLPLHPESLARALKRRELVPCMALTFVVLSFYYGLTTAGGFSQVDYLGEIKQAWIKTLAAAGNATKEMRLARRTATDRFWGEFVFVALATPKKKVPASLIDLILYQDKTTAARLAKLAGTVRLKDALDGMMPEFYKIITGTTLPYDLPRTIPPVITLN